MVLTSWDHGKSNLHDLNISCVVEGLCENDVVQLTNHSHHFTALVEHSPLPIRQTQQTSFKNKEHSDVIFTVDDRPLHPNVGSFSQKSDYFVDLR